MSTTQPQTEEETHKKNAKYFAQLNLKLQSDNEVDYLSATQTLTKWLDSRKAYYTAAKPEIIQCLRAARGTLKRISRSALPFTMRSPPEESLGQRRSAYYHLVKVVEKYKEMFTDVMQKTMLQQLIVSVQLEGNKRPPVPPAIVPKKASKSIQGKSESNPAPPSASSSSRAQIPTPSPSVKASQSPAPNSRRSSLASEIAAATGRSLSSASTRPFQAPIIAAPITPCSPPFSSSTMQEMHSFQCAQGASSETASVPSTRPRSTRVPKPPSKMPKIITQPEAEASSSATTQGRRRTTRSPSMTATRSSSASTPDPTTRVDPVTVQTNDARPSSLAQLSPITHPTPRATASPSHRTAHASVPSNPMLTPVGDTTSASLMDVDKITNIMQQSGDTLTNVVNETIPSVYGPLQQTEPAFTSQVQMPLEDDKETTSSTLVHDIKADPSVHDTNKQRTGENVLGDSRSVGPSGRKGADAQAEKPAHPTKTASAMEDSLPNNGVLAGSLGSPGMADGSVGNKVADTSPKEQVNSGAPSQSGSNSQDAAEAVSMDVDSDTAKNAPSSTRHSVQQMDRDTSSQEVQNTTMPTSTSTAALPPASWDTAVDGSASEVLVPNTASNVQSQLQHPSPVSVSAPGQTAGHKLKAPDSPSTPPQSPTKHVAGPHHPAAGVLPSPLVYSRSHRPASSSAVITAVTPRRAGGSASPVLAKMGVKAGQQTASLQPAVEASPATSTPQTGNQNAVKVATTDTLQPTQTLSRTDPTPPERNTSILTPPTIEDAVPSSPLDVAKMKPPVSNALEPSASANPNVVKQISPTKSVFGKTSWPVPNAGPIAPVQSHHKFQSASPTVLTTPAPLNTQTGNLVSSVEQKSKAREQPNQSGHAQGNRLDNPAKTAESTTGATFASVQQASSPSKETHIQNTGGLLPSADVSLPNTSTEPVTLIRSTMHVPTTDVQPVRSRNTSVLQNDASKQSQPTILSSADPTIGANKPRMSQSPAEIQLPVPDVAHSGSSLASSVPQLSPTMASNPTQSPTATTPTPVRTDPANSQTSSAVMKEKKKPKLKARKSSSNVGPSNVTPVPGGGLFLPWEKADIQWYLASGAPANASSVSTTDDRKEKRRDANEVMNEATGRHPALEGGKNASAAGEDDSRHSRIGYSLEATTVVSESMTEKGDDTIVEAKGVSAGLETSVVNVANLSSSSSPQSEQRSQTFIQSASDTASPGQNTTTLEQTASQSEKSTINRPKEIQPTQSQRSSQMEAESTHPQEPSEFSYRLKTTPELRDAASIPISITANENRVTTSAKAESSSAENRAKRLSNAGDNAPMEIDSLEYSQDVRTTPSDDAIDGVSSRPANGTSTQMLSRENGIVVSDASLSTPVPRQAISAISKDKDGLKRIRDVLNDFLTQEGWSKRSRNLKYDNSVGGQSERRSQIWTHTVDATSIIRPTGEAEEKTNGEAIPTFTFVPCGSSRFHPNETILADFDIGMSHRGDVIKLTLDMSNDQLASVNLWSKWFKCDADPSHGLCISLACYPNKVLLKWENMQERNDKELIAELLRHKSSWPINNKLYMKVGGEQMSLSPPPLMVRTLHMLSGRDLTDWQATAEGFVDISILAKTRLLEIRLEHYDSMMQYLFVLLVHPPTQSQLDQVNKVRQNKVQWKNALHNFSRPLTVAPFRPTLATQS